ncbi:MAG: hypothetical protein NTZ73_02055 [Candidatus Diapherotrites archaeon]|nr:hypothetical protein [Candidatus Diapherotrites archaeon]
MAKKEKKKIKKDFEGAAKEAKLGATSKTAEKKAEEKKGEANAAAETSEKKEKKEEKGKTAETAKKIVKKKFIAREKKIEMKKSAEALELQKKLKGRKWHPVFRGRFGKKCIRRKSIEKWDKWRKSRSIDSDTGLRHGFKPKIGYGNPAEIRGIHPSGYVEVRVHNVKELEKINPKTEAGRISATVGKKKRNEIIVRANEKKIKILN